MKPGFVIVSAGFLEALARGYEDLQADKRRLMDTNEKLFRQRVSAERQLTRYRAEIRELKAEQQAEVQKEG